MVAILISNKSMAQVEPHSFTITKRLTLSAINDCVQFGTISNGGKGTYGKIRVTTHNCGQLFIAEYDFFGDYYGGKTTDWIEVPIRNGEDYDGIQSMALDVRHAADGGPFDLRLRRLSGGCPGLPVDFDIYIETNTTFSEQSLEGTASPNTAGYLGKTSGWQFPVATARFTSSREGLFILNNGNVGIGTIKPLEKLDVSGSLLLGSQSVNANTTKLFLRNPAGKTWTLSSGGNNIDENDFALYNWSNDQSAPFFYIKSEGNIGIGTTRPTEKLSVNGNIRSKKVIVTQNGWPDYVFESNYKLLSLKEVDQYIKQHKHLPDVPSAKEVEKNGLDVGENQAVLLKKIEELTLYIIKLNEKLDQQSQEIRMLKERNDKQQPVSIKE